MPLEDSDLEKWEYKTHTKVKHEILKKYIIGWLRHLSSTNSKLCIFDGFAGRGKYKGNEDGSPIIILDCIASCSNLFGRAICTFIEKNPNNFDNLKKVVEEKVNSDKAKYDKIKIIEKNDEFSNVVSEILSNLSVNLAPSFFFIDPFGFGGIPFEIIKKIISAGKTELFITFMTRDINRFLSDSSKNNTLNDLFGTSEWKNIINCENPQDKENKLRDLYIKQLINDGKISFVNAYKVKMDENNQTIYYLIHATNHVKGLMLMTDIMWNQSTSGGTFEFLGPKEGQYRICDFSNNTPKIKEFLTNKFSKQKLTFEKLLEEAYKECYKNSRFIGIAKHYRAALKELLNDGKIKREPELTEKGKVRTGIDYEDEITFLV